MSGRRAILAAGVLYMTLPSAGATSATVDASELARCAAVAASDERLECYDTLARSVQALAAQSQPPPLNPSQPSAVLPQQASSAPAPADGSSFGMPKPQPVVPAGPEQIKAVVDQVTEDRLGNLSVVLDNGQTWTFMETGGSLRPGEVVTVKRAALGSFLLTTRARRSYRVRRLR